jgi:LruC domain-containing protein
VLHFCGRWVLGALVLALPAAASAQDSDGDGVSDGADSFPCDGFRAGVSYFPGASSSALLTFEDQWPGATDLDFNDVAVRVHYRLERNAAGNVVSLAAVFDAVALGGDLSSGLGLVLPTSRAGVTAQRRIAGGGWQGLTVESDANATMVLSANLRELYGNAGGRINAVGGQTYQSAQRLELEVTFAPPAALSTAAAPFDVFIFRAGSSPRHEIHFPQFGGTSAMLSGLFNTAQDGSTSTRRFLHLSGVPAALNLMDSTRYPLEGVQVSALFPDITGFASSGGSQNAAFYSSTVVAAQGHNVPASALPSVPAASTTCISSIVTAGLQLHLNLGTTSPSPQVSGTTWADQSGFARNGLLRGASPAPQTTIDGVPALHLRGSSSGQGDIEVTNFYTNVIGGDSTHTVEVWLYLPSSASASAMDAFNTGNCDVSMCLAYLESGSSYDRSGARGVDAGVVPGAWRHHALVQDGSVVRTYRDGVLVAQRSDWEAPTATVRNLVIGSRGWANRTQNWYVNRVRYYSNALTAAQIQQNYDAERAAVQRASGMVPNGDFGSDLTGWVVEDAGAPSWDGSSGRTAAGAALIPSTSADPRRTWYLSPCIAVQPSTAYTIGGSFRLVTGTSVTCSTELMQYAGSTCSNWAGTYGTGAGLAVNTSTWSNFQFTPLTTASNVGSARVRTLCFSPAGSGAFTVLADDVFLRLR